MGGADDSKTKSEPPQWWEDAAKKALATGEKVARKGYVPYMGPDVAAFDPQMIDAMQQANDWSAAFMTPGQAPADASASIMPVTDYGNGLRGYSSYGGFQDSIAALREAYPGLANYLDSFFINPTTGRFPGGGAGGFGGDPVTPPPVTPPPTSPPPTSPPGGDGGGGGGGPPPPGQRVPGMRGRTPNGGMWKIDAKGRLITYSPNAFKGIATSYGGDGGKGNFRSREGYAGGNPTRL